jgi:hypothetical protein
MNSIQYYKDCNNFIDHPLAPLFYQFVEILEKRGFYKEAEDLQKIAEKYYLPRDHSKPRAKLSHANKYLASF